MLLLVVAGTVQAQSKHVQLEFISNVSAARPGEPFMVGLHFRIDPKWHIYWSNPGPAGIPTRVKWTLPDGVTAGPLRFPVPMRFVQPGDIVGYGYEDEVLIMAEVTPPPGLTADSITLSADVSWLCCADICVMGKKSVQLTVPLAEQAKPANEALFAQWQDRLPQAGSADSGGYVSAVEVQTPAPGRTQAVVRWNRQPQAIDFYPGGHKALEVSEPSVQTAGSGDNPGETVIDVTAQPLPGQKQWPTALESVLVYQTDTGERRGVLIPMAVPPAPEPNN